MDSSRVLWLSIHFAVLTASFVPGNSSAAPGDLDAGYGQNGRVVLQVPPNSRAFVQTLLQLSDGKTVVAGSVQSASGASLGNTVVARLDGNGDLDATFGVNGIAQFNIAGKSLSTEFVATQADGKLIIAGNANGSPSSPGNNPIVLRVNVDGSLDGTFGANGIAVLPSSYAPFGLRGCVVQPSGNIVVMGSAQGVAFVRLLGTNGSPDLTFGTNGLTTIRTSGNEFIWGAIGQSDGKVVAVGQALSGTSSFAVRITSDGMPDTTFNGSGQLTTLCPGQCGWFGVTSQPDGKLILSGYTSFPGSGTPLLQQRESIVARYNLDGTPDVSFGNNGAVRSVFSGAYYGQPLQTSEQARKTMVDSMGRITIVGATLYRNYIGGLPTTYSADTVLTRVDSNGALDSSFGRQGYSIVDFNTADKIAQPTAGPLVESQDGHVLVLTVLDWNPPTTIAGTDFTSVLTRLSNGSGHPGLLSVIPPGAPLTEGATAVFRVRRTGGALGNVSVAYGTVSESAVAGSDFTAVSGVLNWQDGESSEKLVSVPIAQDGVTESSDKSFKFVLSNPGGGAALAADTGRASIVRDDVPVPITLSIQGTATVAENQSGVTLTVSRSGSTYLPISVNYFTLPESASAVQDYVTTTGVLNWGAGDATLRTITVPLVDNGLHEASENFRVLLWAPSLGVTFGAHAATVTITDNDTPPTISLTDATASVTEGQSSIALTLIRTGATAATISVNYATSDGTASAGADYTAANGVITWLPTDGDTKVITIPISDDSAVEPAETFSVTLSNPTNGAVLATNVANLTIQDNDVAPPTNGNGSGGGGGISAGWIMILISLTAFRRVRFVRVGEARRNFAFTLSMRAPAIVS